MEGSISYTRLFILRIICILEESIWVSSLVEGDFCE